MREFCSGACAPGTPPVSAPPQHDEKQPDGQPSNGAKNEEAAASAPSGEVAGEKPKEGSVEKPNEDEYVPSEPFNR